MDVLKLGGNVMLGRSQVRGKYDVGTFSSSGEKYDVGTYGSWREKCDVETFSS